MRCNLGGNCAKFTERIAFLNASVSVGVLPFAPEILMRIQMHHTLVVQSLLMTTG